MTTRHLFAAVGALALIASLTACASATPSPADSTPAGQVIAPITMPVGDLDGTTVNLVVGQALNIATGDVDVTSFTATVVDPAVAEFTPGRIDSSATFNPGFMARAEGTTTVELHSSTAPDEIAFTIVVSPRG
ncbi:MAG: hypothetical protein ABS63_05625 [Microbacterium sp. SCN 70-27]|uniref:hypothetical protein n=1 Tax=unclassified Microbacterium TaxID=2609290 RepID=UPI00086C78DD|nr:MULTISPECIES: hypothetical protein [unclassified Microbacterium]MBN9225618.1 hypothetical protein [Microbacterium sp.]ODT28057.1 MAG: hypothetical protein ABS63_05625 [Microbacterium sp. SCN 70-27]